MLFSRLFCVAASRLNSPRFQGRLYARSTRAVKQLVEQVCLARVLRTQPEFPRRLTFPDHQFLFEEEMLLVRFSRNHSHDLVTDLESSSRKINGWIRGLTAV